MCCKYQSFILFFYCVAINSFYLFLRYVAFEDYFECFFCQEMNPLKINYDYIVVGGGSSGSIIARRLAQDPNVTVLLIEAGGYGNWILDIPALTPMIQNSIYDWKYQTVPQKSACLGLDNKQSLWPMGKIMGGTGRLNNMLYVRGHPEDYSHWYRNKRDYNYKVDIEPYFNKLETYGTYDPRASTVISALPFASNLSNHILQSALDLGYSISDGVYAEPGFMVPKVTQYNGVRWTSGHQLLKLNQKNLRILPNCLAYKILLKNNYEAYGVRYSYLENNFTVTASKGVILAAGAIGTPKILMLSGIGPKHTLEKLKIKPRLDLPVGYNLQDHVTTGLDLVLLESSLNVGLDYWLSPYSAYQYFFKSKGPLTTSSCEHLAFFSSHHTVPDLQLMVVMGGVSSDKGTFFRSLMGVGDYIWDNYFSKINKTAITILPVVLHPKSRGTITLKDRNPKSQPVIDPNYLAEKYDVDVLVRGIQMIKKLISSAPLSTLGASLNSNVFPGCEKFKFDSVPYWECYVRHLTLTSYHPVGTCALEQVVNFDFQVKGTNKLYVVDGSILPQLPSSNPIAAIMMMAEKAADVLKEHRWMENGKSLLIDVFIKSTTCHIF